MTIRLINALEKGLSSLAQEVDQGASVLMQFASGDIQEIKAAFEEYKASLEQKVEADVIQPVEEAPAEVLGVIEQDVVAPAETAVARALDDAAAAIAPAQGV